MYNTGCSFNKMELALMEQECRVTYSNPYIVHRHKTEDKWMDSEYRLILDTLTLIGVSEQTGFAALMNTQKATSHEHTYSKSNYIPTPIKWIVYRINTCTAKSLDEPRPIRRTKICNSMTIAILQKLQLVIVINK